MNKILLGSVVVFLVVVAYLVGKTQNGQLEPKVESAQTSQIEAISTPEPTQIPSPTPEPTTTISKKEASTQSSCDELIQDLLDQYQNLYTVDDVLLSSNMECHYAYQRSLGLQVNNGHIRDQRDVLWARARALNPQPQSGGNTVPDTSSDDCQLRLAKYSACMSEYNAEMAEYSACVAEKATNPYKICIKPFNICGIKPVCF